MPNVQSEEESDDQDLNERQANLYKTEVEGQQEGEEPSPRKVRSFEKAEARVLMEKLATVTDANLDSHRVEDYDEYFKDLYSTMIATGKMREGSMKQAYVDKYQDKPVRIETTDAHSVLLYVPYIEFMQAVNSFGRDQKDVEKLLYECMPNLNTYAQGSIQKVFNCFQEFHFS